MWEYIKIALFIVFLLCCLVLPFMLIALAILKKKLSIYKDQVKKSGEISEPNTLKITYDLLLMVYLFESVPDKNQYPKLYKFSKTKSLIENINILTKIVKPIALICALVSITLIISLNIMEG